ncbi:heme transporter [Gordonia sp. X0973]|uniref:ChuX/HutX family heme-like substrate-binding protein n=1 Tax=Gordonia sp. X0973 TaxID=2742602 RepID=UPI0013EACD08|nr:ChuX/HutX family heme-like substrate-binding protein [Gordonia sp. X0973]QKT06841.1 heme transporter [Gordonia sp. X0973]
MSESHHRCCHAGALSDLDRLLATPDLTATVIDRPASEVLAELPRLQQVVGVTVAGAVIVNDVGAHHRPAHRGDPLRIPTSGIGLRISPDLTDTVLITDPTPRTPPTVRVFDRDGKAAHVTYLLEESDRLAFEALRLSLSADIDLRDRPDADDASQATETDSATAYRPDPDDEPSPVDQVELFDSILADGGRARRGSLVHDEAIQVNSRAVIATLKHAARLTLPITMGATGPGCLQIRHGAIHHAREHLGSMVLTSGPARTMIDFNLIGQCWVTTVAGPWGPTAAVELYDQRGRCCFIATQTGLVSESTFDAWETLLGDLSDTRI